MAKRAPEGDRPSTDEMRDATEPESHDTAREDARRGPAVERDEPFDPSSRGDDAGEVM